MLKKIKKLVSALRVTRQEARLNIKLVEKSAGPTAIPTGRAVIQLGHTYVTSACSITLDSKEWESVRSGVPLKVRGSRTRLSDGSRCWLWWQFEGGAGGQLSCEAHQDDGVIVPVYKGRLAPELVREAR